MSTSAPSMSCKGLFHFTERNVYVIHTDNTWAFYSGKGSNFNKGTDYDDTFYEGYEIQEDRILLAPAPLF